MNKCRGERKYSLTDEEYEFLKQHCQKDELLWKYKRALEEADEEKEEKTKYREQVTKLKERISELESELSVKENLLKIKNGLRMDNDLSGLTPIKATELIIENFKQGTYPIYERDSNGDIKYMDIGGEKYAVETGKYRKHEEVRQIAEYLLVYCNYNSDNAED